ncbi:MAG: peptidylprolyl isomerase [Rhodospirillales bacterium]|nr:peptidylprolyl isomerase [Rhodospirillales bacterium]MCW8862796.1 peptidylprolyl isomerase [Rhodospirillales bacterium]MCW8952651.1 peptidylprolyl isomerase [Rhodospirillales bacterium]MCW8970775.1 peptidylprolyl isomerase [Rhodospirillales bacterium]MCW9003246.1 peptidylprolyl isomerase [Rhodospirillales bacterium]
MSQAKDGDTVSIHYSGTLDDGTMFDSSVGNDPLEFTLGTGSVIPGFESAVTGMKVGDKKSTTIPATEAYGPHDPEMVQEVPREQIPPEVELEVGGQLQAQGPDGQVFVLTVSAFNENTVTLDGNHPLAGKDLTFEIELVGIA